MLRGLRVFTRRLPQGDVTFAVCLSNCSGVCNNARLSPNPLVRARTDDHDRSLQLKKERKEFAAWG